MKQLARSKISFILMLLMIFLIAPAVHALPVPVENFSFESAPGTLQSQPGYNIWTTEGLDGWTYEGTGRVGHWRYTTYQYAAPIPDGYYIGFMESGSIYQDTGWEVAANNEFTLSVDIGNRLDIAFGTYSVELLAGDNVLAVENSVMPAEGQFTTLTLNYLAMADDISIGSTLGIRITASGKQLNFDNIRLTNDYFGNEEIPKAVPEPGTMFLLGIGLLTIGGIKRFKRMK